MSFEVSRLKNLQNTLAKEENAILENIAKCDEGNQISELQKKLLSTREKEEKKIKETIKNIIITLRNVKNTIYNDFDLDLIDLRQLKNEMITLQSNIEDLKTQMKDHRDCLEKEEMVLNNEIESYEQKLPEWTKPIRYFCSSEYKIQKSLSAKQNGSVCPEVAEFMHFLDTTGGHENGWTSDDHRLFLKIRKKCRTPEEMAENLHAFLPDKDIIEILAHEKWYVKYLHLKRKHKEAINKWRNSKSAKVLCNKVAAKTISFKPKTEIYSKEEIKAKLAAWKIEKQEKQLRQKEYEIQRKAKEKQLEELRRQNNERIKQTVDTWKQSKLVEAQERKLENELKQLQERIDKASLANRLIKMYQLNDHIFIERMRQNHLSRTRSEEIKIKRSDKAVRDPERIFKPTKQWISRTQKNVENHEKSTCNLTTIPKLAVPTWRRSIS